MEKYQVYIKVVRVDELGQPITITETTGTHDNLDEEEAMAMYDVLETVLNTL